jgi:tRNA pseudouridine55 synthase
MPLNGLLILDKPPAMTSHDVVAIVRRATGEKSIGHLGTLDPMATGVLPLLLGRYTRLAQFFGHAEKHYTGEIRFGFATDTYDADGMPTSDPKPLTLCLSELQKLAARFHGEIDQLPPIYSAKKLGGIAAHKLARAGQPVPVKPVRITIHEFQLRSLEGDLASFSITVSAGGYVRSVAHEVGELAGCGAHLAGLRRTRAGAFTLAQAVTVDQLKDAAASPDPEAVFAELLPHPRTLLLEIPAVTVDEQVAGRLRNGMTVNLPEYSHAPLVKVFTDPTELIGIARRVAGTLMQPHVIIG